MTKNKKDVGAIVRRSGVSFRVWAPFADRVNVSGSFNNWGELPLVSEGDGYWSNIVRGATSGQEYKFIIYNGDEKLVRNDPRALHFPTSSGTSVVAASSSSWEEDNFVPPAIDQMVIYELHVGTYNRPDPAINGTFYNLIEKLDYIKDLGVNMIELMPISTMLMDRGWGYAIDYIFAVESLYGGRHGLVSFVKAAHERGIGVILDVVYNHFGPDVNLDLWNFDGWHKENYGGIYFYNDWRAVTPWGNTRPDFGRPEVKQYILDNVRMWINDCHIDGLRVDSTIYIRNVNGSNNDPANDLPEGWELLQEINSISKKINPLSIVIAEDIAANDYIVKPLDEGGAGFDAQWELGFPSILKDILSTNDPKRISLSNLLEELKHTYNANPFTRIIFSESHDSSANGSGRLSEIIAPTNADGLFARQQSLIAAAIIMTCPGIPMLFMGQEFQQGGEFNDWQGLDWSRSERLKGITDAYRHLIALRKNTWSNSAGLSGAGLDVVHVDEINKVIAYHRWKYGGQRDDTFVVVNFSDCSFEKYEISFPRTGLWRLRFNSCWKGYAPDFKGITVEDVLVDKESGVFVLPPACALIFSQD